MMVQQNSPLRFAIVFILLFLALYYLNIVFFSITTPGSRHYVPFFADHLNYIKVLRDILIACSATVLRWFGFAVVANDYSLLVAGRGMITLVYSCLGLGVMSFFTAFVIAYPKAVKAKIIFLVSGLPVIQLLNITRFVVLALFWNNRSQQIIDHHTIFNALIYIIIAISLYFWVKAGIGTKPQHVKNRA